MSVIPCRGTDGRQGKRFPISMWIDGICTLRKIPVSSSVATSALHAHRLQLMALLSSWLMQESASMLHACVLTLLSGAAEQVIKPHRMANT